MTDLEIFEEIKKIISEDFGLPQEEIEEESLLEEDLGISDLDMEDLISKLEGKYDIKIPLEKIPSFRKISDLVSYLYEKTEEIS